MIELENSSNNSKYEEVVKLIDKYAALTTNIPAEKIEMIKQVINKNVLHTKHS